ncbi:hypothetical protein BKA82DRAFT_4099206 [Pisolithus tinctorius]|nr:hypothetical protein BKA82DRAFT_4099206 [Pisolithus tinctorius]
MDDAWQAQDMAPSGISIPTNGSGAPAEEPVWNGGGRSPVRERGEPPRRSSRSMSPGRDDRGSHRVDTRDLEQAFVKIGRVMYDPHTRESRGFGFVTMETAEEADAAITALNATELMGKVMTVEKARRGRARTPTPGRYYGPPKRYTHERPYDPRPYDSRYSRARDHDRGHREYDRGYRDYDRGYRDYERGGRYDDRRY